jgi:predicted NAD/FAD-binding protein
VYSVAAVGAQQRWREINGTDRTWYCGAWWGNGFHEDGFTSGLECARSVAGEDLWR